MDIISGQRPGLLCPLPDSSCWQRAVAVVVVVVVGSLQHIAAHPGTPLASREAPEGFFPWDREQEGFLLAEVSEEKMGLLHLPAFYKLPVGFINQNDWLFSYPNQVLARNPYMGL